MKTYTSFFALLFLCFGSCKKDATIEINYITLNVNEDIPIHKLFFTNNNVAYACGGTRTAAGAIFKTTDAGSTWQKVFSNSNECVYDICFANDTLGFACGENLLLLKTTDGGITWARYAYPTLPPSGFIGSLRSIYCVDANTIYVAGGIAFESGIAYKTYTSGDFWIYNTFGNELRSVVFTNKYKGLYAGYGIILKTTDSAVTFSATPAQDDFFTSLCSVGAHTTFACGYNGGIYKSTDEAATWNLIYKNSSSAHPSHFNCICAASSTIVYAAGNSGLIVFSENGEEFKTIKKFTDDNLLSIFSKDDKVYISAEGGKIYCLKR